MTTIPKPGHLYYTFDGSKKNVIPFNLGAEGAILPISISHSGGVWFINGYVPFSRKVEDIFESKELAEAKTKI